MSPVRVAKNDVCHPERSMIGRLGRSTCGVEGPRDGWHQYWRREEFSLTFVEGLP